MRRIIILVIGVLLFGQGCTLVPSQLLFVKEQQVSHKQKKPADHKLEKQHHKTDKKHPFLKARINLVSFQLFEKDQHKSKKHHKKKQTTPATGSVSTAYFAFGAGLVEIPWQGTTLLPFLIENELGYAVETTQAMIRKEAVKDAKEKAVDEADEAALKAANEADDLGASNEEADAIEEKVKADLFPRIYEKKFAQYIAEKKAKVKGIQDLHPDVIILQRGSVATVIPRAMLGFPQIASMPVVPNDSIITLDIKEQKLTENNDNTGAYNLLSNNVPKGNQRFTLRGLTKQSGIVDTKEGAEELTTVQLVTEKYSQEFNPNVPAVTVVYRYYLGQLFRIIMPNEHYGVLKKPEDPKSNVSAGEKTAIENPLAKWNQSYDDFNGMAIRNGDVIEFTTLDLLDRTSPVQAVPAVR